MVMIVALELSSHFVINAEFTGGRKQHFPLTDDRASLRRPLFLL